jgi:hypothetical protein
MFSVKASSVVKARSGLVSITATVAAVLLS